MFRLVDLNMSNNLLAPECISELTKWPWFRRLRALSLANNGIADAAVIGLGDAEDMPELLSLDISIPYQGRPAMKVGPVNNFLERLPAPNLRWLTLNNLPVGARAKKLIAERGYRVTPALA